MSQAPFAYSANASIKGLKGGRKVCTVGGTAEKLAAVETACGGVLIQALRTNSGNVTVGGPDVDSTPGTENGIELVPGQSQFIPIDDISKVWIDADNNGEGVQYSLYNG